MISGTASIINAPYSLQDEPTITTPFDGLQQRLALAAFVFVASIFPGTQTHIGATHSFVGISATPTYVRALDDGLRQAIFIRRAYMRLRDIADVAQANAARTVLERLESAVAQTGAKHLPAVHLAEVESTSTVLIEWIFPTCRLFFNIEQDTVESGWGFVSQSGEMIWGNIDSADYTSLVDTTLRNS